MALDIEKWRAAIRTNNVKEVLAQIKSGADVNGQIKGVTPLVLAAMFGSTDVARELIAAGAQVNQTYENNETPLIAAARGGYQELVQLLLEHRADPRHSSEFQGDALTLVAVCGDTPSHLAVLDLLIKAGASPEKTKEGRFILPTAARNKRLKGLVKRLIAAGADVNVVDPLWDATPLHLAIDADNGDAVAELLAAGANSKIKAPPSKAAWSELTPMEYAEKTKKKKILLLFQSGSTNLNPKPQTKKYATIAEAWESIEQHLKRIDAKVHKSLQPGASPAELDRLASAFATQLPEDVIESYQHHNGQKKPGILCLLDSTSPGYRLLSIREAIAEIEIMRDLLESGDFDGLEASPDTGVRSDWWNESWFPLASNGLGDLLCVDMTPAKGGKKGQIITFFHEHGQRRKLASSLKEWFAQVSHELSETSALL